MKRLIMVAMAGVAATVARSADVYWDNFTEGVALDLATASNWKGGAVPELKRSEDGTTTKEENSDTAIVAPPDDGANLTLTLSRDLAVKGFRIGHNDTQFSRKKWFDVTLDLGADHTLDCWGTANTYPFSMGHQYLGYGRVRLTSGTIRKMTEPSGNSEFFMRRGKGFLEFYVDGAASKVIFPQVSFAANNGLFCVTNGGFVKAKLMVNQGTDVVCTNSVVKITGAGSLWDNDNQNTYIYPNANSPANEFLLHLDDGGVMSNFYGSVGCRGSNAKILVENGARLHLTGGVDFGGNQENFPTNNVMEVRRNGLVVVRPVDTANEGNRQNAFVVGSAGADNRLHVHDGGVVTNFHGTVGKNGSDSRVLVENGGEVHIVNSVWVGSPNGTATSSNNVFEISSGGLVVATNKNAQGSFTSAFIIGNGGTANNLLVRKGGVLHVGNLRLGNAASSHGNFTTIADGGKMYVHGQLWLGIKNWQSEYDVATNNVLDVKGEGSLVELAETSTTQFYVAGENNGILLHDHAAITNQATHSGLNIRSQIGGGTYVKIFDHGEYYSPRWVKVGSSVDAAKEPDKRSPSKRARLSVFDHGRMILGSALYLGAAEQNARDEDGDPVVYDNAIHVGSDGLIQCTSFNFEGYGNKVVISNGLLQATHGGVTSTKGSSAENGGATRFVFEGAAPQLKANGPMSFGVGAQLTFRVPDEGYLAGHALVDSENNTINVDASCTLAVEVSKKFKDGGTFTLMDARNKTLTVDAGVLAAANARIQGLGELSVTPDNHKLMLKVYNRNGTVIVVR